MTKPIALNSPHKKAYYTKLLNHQQFSTSPFNFFKTFKKPANQGIDLLLYYFITLLL